MIATLSKRTSRVEDARFQWNQIQVVFKNLASSLIYLPCSYNWSLKWKQKTHPHRELRREKWGSDLYFDKKEKRKGCSHHGCKQPLPHWESLSYRPSGLPHHDIGSQFHITISSQPLLQYSVILVLYLPYLRFDLHPGAIYSSVEPVHTGFAPTSIGPS